jgi:hypothetical protein
MWRYWIRISIQSKQKYNKQKQPPIMKKIKSVKFLLIKKCSNRKLGYSKRKTKEQKSL